MQSSGFQQPLDTTQAPTLTHSPSSSAQHGSFRQRDGCLSDRGGRSSPGPRLGTDSPKGVNRVAQYEAMNSVSAYGGGGSDVGFIVTKTDWAGKDLGDTPIARFPNEVLLHTLSFLEPQALFSASLISKRFHALVNSPHAWRSAFLRFFPPSSTQVDNYLCPTVSQDRRYFTRLSTADVVENDWQKEYTQRTRLLRKLAKGHGGSQVTYAPRTGHFSVSHMAVNFGSKEVRAVHASLETLMVTASDPTTGAIEKRAQSPLGAIELVPDLRSVQGNNPEHEIAHDMNVNRIMDISEEIGWIMAENVPDGRCYVHPYPNPYISDALHGDRSPLNYVQPGNDTGSMNERIYGDRPAFTSVWIAKKRSVVDTTGAAVIVGNSRGYIRIFSIHFGRSSNVLWPVSSYCVSPGVPIVQIKVDEDFLPRRHRQKRPWLVVINALGEVYYLRNMAKEVGNPGWKMIPTSARVAAATYDDLLPGLSQREYPTEPAQLLRLEYAKVKELWHGCYMDRFIEVDWAGGNIISGRINKGPRRWGQTYEVEPDEKQSVLKRYHLHIPHRADGVDVIQVQRDGQSTPCVDTGSPDDEDEAFRLADCWVTSKFALPGDFSAKISAYSLDNSNLARLSASEDPTVREGMPGGNGRLFTVGTDTGNIFVYNIRTSAASESQYPKEVRPMRVIHTDSPRISTLAVSSLVVVHGGDDGLVQAWDPLGSTNGPVRTLHSRFSAKARRRLEQHAGVRHMVTDNQFAARCLSLDPNPSNLRGAVALGTLIRYWSYSADTALKKSRKKAGRGGKRSAPATPSRIKGGLKEIIRNDEDFLRKERERVHKEKIEMEKRFGVGMGKDALSEEEMLAYAQLVSMETFEAESSGKSEISSSTSGTGSEFARHDGFNGAEVEGAGTSQEDADFERALRLSLQDVEVCETEDNKEVWEDPSQFPDSPSGPSNHGYPFISTKSQYPANGSPVSRRSPKKNGWAKIPLGALDEWPSPSQSASRSPVENGWSGDANGDGFDDDLELAIRLSLQEHEQQNEGKGKGKGRG